MIERRSFLKSLALVGTIPTEKLLSLFEVDKTKPEKTQLIFSNADDTDAKFEVKLLPPGRYTAVCDYASVMPSRAGDHEILILRWKVLDHTEPAVVAQYISTRPKGLFCLKDLMKKLGIEHDWGFDTQELIGKKAIVDVTQRAYESFRYNSTRVLKSCLTL